MVVRLAALLFLVALGLGALLPSGAAAQTGATGAGTAEAGTTQALPQAVEGEPQARSEPGLWSRIVTAVRLEQRRLHQELTRAIRDLREEHSLATAWSLLLLSFLYGLFHAAGPGHGKAVISAYLLTHESQVRRGLWLAATASLVQGITAIVLVQGVVALIGWTRRDAQAAVGTLESISFALIAALGAGLTLRALWALWRRFGARRSAAAASDHAHDHGCSSGCGHQHVPSQEQLSQPASLRSLVAIVLSIGIRPCSGAVLVLIFAEILDLRLIGILSVIAMSVGTALAVSALALLTVMFRRAAVSLTRLDGARLALAGNAVAMLGGIAIMGLGVSLLLASLGPAHPLM